MSQENIKVKFTDEGGFAVKLTNKTGASSVKGTCVEASTATDNAFQVSAISAIDSIGFVYESGVADGSECWVVVNGIAEALLEDETASTRNYWVGSGDTTAGRVNMDSASPPNATRHFEECGHCIESKASGTNVLAKMIVHHN